MYSTVTLRLRNGFAFGEVCHTCTISSRDMDYSSMSQVRRYWKFLTTLYLIARLSFSRVHLYVIRHSV